MVVVCDGLLEAFQPRIGPGPFEIEPSTIRINTDRLGAIGDDLLEPVPIGVINPDAGLACRVALVVPRKGATENVQL